MTDLASENMRLKFAYENNVPPIMKDRLRGDTVEELAADWANLSVHIPAKPDPSAPRVPAPVPHQGPQPGPQKTSDDHFYESIYGVAK